MSFRMLKAAALAAMVALAPIAAGQAAPTSGLETLVRTDAGYVAGLGGEVRTYKGIPYAAPPVGPLRWKPPQPVKPWETVRLAKNFSPACTASEDCLTLNVWTPARIPDARLPVVFWIHGGGFAAGSSSQPAYDGSVLARQGVVVVSINYRLGQYGFFAHPELSAESPQGVSGNQGLLDMVHALKWVQTNIAGFGGDPGNVTIFGESAGGAAVGLLLVTPLSEGLFHKAVASSPWNLYQPISHLKRDWYGRPSAEAAGAARGTLADLRNQPFGADRGGVAAAVAGTATGTAPYAVVDGFVIPDDPARLFEQGKFHKVPVMIGGNADDGSIAGGRAANLAEARALAERRAGGDPAALVGLYGDRTDAEANASARKLMGDLAFALGERQMLRAFARASTPAYAYEFARAAPLYRRQNQGAIHAADVSYFFGTLPDSAYGGGGARPGDYDAIDDRVSKEMMGALVAFARTGSPNAPGLPPWPEYTEGAEAYLEWNDATTVKRHMRQAGLEALWAAFRPKMEANR